jgi:hypothetical protein
MLVTWLWFWHFVMFGIFMPCCMLLFQHITWLCILMGHSRMPCSYPSKQVITTGALVMELSAALVLGATVVTYDYLSQRESMFG